MHPSIQLALSNRICSLKGIPGHSIGPDMVSEKVRLIRIFANLTF
jgi:hypothetical protein